MGNSMSEKKPSAKSSSNPSSLGDEIVARIDQLAAISETPEHLARVFLTDEHRKAADLILSWMREAGMSAHLDAIGNVCGRYEGERPGLPALMLGSHYDTVRDAGRWDGPLGVITAIACVAELNRHGKRLPFAILMHLARNSDDCASFRVRRAGRLLIRAPASIGLADTMVAPGEA